MEAEKTAGQANIVEQEDLTAEEQLAELQAQLAAATARNLQLEGENSALQEKVDSRKGMLPGWVITTPNPLFNGTTSKIRFTNGIGFIPGEDEDRAKRLCDDFGYTRQFVENYLAEPSLTEGISNSLAELAVPQFVK